MRLLAAILLFSMLAFGQIKTAAPGQLNVLIDSCAQTPWLIQCVSQVNGIPVCAYGRVGYYPLPGQPYTIQTYPKVDANGNPIDVKNGGKACVSTLHTADPDDPRYWIPPFIW